MGIARSVSGFWAFIETHEFNGQWKATWSLHKDEPDIDGIRQQSRVSGATTSFATEAEALAQAEVDASRTARTLTGTELG